MKNKYGIPGMILGGVMVLLGIMLIAFPPPGNVSTGISVCIWMGLVFFFSGLYKSTRTPKQFRKDFDVPDERTKRLDEKAAYLSFFVTLFMCVAAALLTVFVAPENEFALILIGGLVIISGLTFVLARVIYERKM